jgi:hypothetical protein
MAYAVRTSSVLDVAAAKLQNPIAQGKKYNAIDGNKD